MENIVGVLLRAIQTAATEAYQSEVVSTQMEHSVIGENGTHQSKEQWIEERIEEWKHTNDRTSTALPGVVCSDLLSELRDTCYKLDQLMEQAHGPGRHGVFMAIREARCSLGDAAICEDGRIKDLIFS